MDTRDLGLVVVALGGGRSRVEDTIDHSVGLVFEAALGDRIERGQPLVTIHAKDQSSAKAAAHAFAAHIHIAPESPKKSPVVLETIE